MNSNENWQLITNLKNVSRETLTRFTIFHDLLKQWQNRINLIAPSTIDEIWSRHIADSVQSCLIVDDAQHIIDIGSGAGFPGLIYAILLAEELSQEEQGTLTNKKQKRVDLIESNGKKCAFLNAVIRETGLKKNGLSIEVHHGRIEHVLKTLPQPDGITARALASLDDLFMMTETFLGNGSWAVFPKGRDYQQEIIKAEKKWQFDREITPSSFESDSVLLKISNLKRL